LEHSSDQKACALGIWHCDFKIHLASEDDESQFLHLYIFNSKNLDKQKYQLLNQLSLYDYLLSSYPHILLFCVIQFVLQAYRVPNKNASRYAKRPPDPIPGVLCSLTVIMFINSDQMHLMLS